MPKRTRRRRSAERSAPAYFAVVRGPLGAGKTTVARALARAVGGRVVSIDALLERFPWDGGSERLFRRANAAAVRTARPWLARGIPVIFDGNFYWSRVLEELRRALPVPHRVFRLRVPLAVCIERDRARSRSHGAAATREVFRKAGRVRQGSPIDGTQPVSRAVAQIRARLPARPRPRRAPRPRSLSGRRRGGAGSRRTP